MNHVTSNNTKVVLKSLLQLIENFGGCFSATFGVEPRFVHRGAPKLKTNIFFSTIESPWNEITKNNMENITPIE